MSLFWFCWSEGSGNRVIAANSRDEALAMWESYDPEGSFGVRGPFYSLDEAWAKGLK